MSMSEDFSVLFYTLVKLCYTKALEWSSPVPGPKVKSSSEIMNPNTVHCKLSIIHVLCFLNWRIISWQRCVGFCCITAWISYMYTYIPSLSAHPPTHPLCHHRAVHPEGSLSWVFIGRTDAEAETPILWPPHAKSWLLWKDPDAGKDWGQEEKGTTEDEMVGWHCRLNGHGFGWTLGVGDGQGGLACCGSWGRQESDTTEWLNSTELSALCCIAASC